MKKFLFAFSPDHAIGLFVDMMIGIVYDLVVFGICFSFGVAFGVMSLNVSPYDFAVMVAAIIFVCSILRWFRFFISDIGDDRDQS
jgi:hypothetical protein